MDLVSQEFDVTNIVGVGQGLEAEMLVTVIVRFGLLSLLLVISNSLLPRSSFPSFIGSSSLGRTSFSFLLTPKVETEPWSISTISSLWTILSRLCRRVRKSRASMNKNITEPAPSVYHAFSSSAGSCYPQRGLDVFVLVITKNSVENDIAGFARTSPRHWKKTMSALVLTEVVAAAHLLCLIAATR
jgi:hypothetical protein